MADDDTPDHVPEPLRRDDRPAEPEAGALRLGRRDVLRTLTLASAGAALGCDDGASVRRVDGGLDAGGTQDAGQDLGVDAGRDLGVDAGRDLGVDAGRDLGIDAGRDLGVDAGTRPTCNDTSTLTPSQLLAPIDTIVVLMMENRSFDHYLGALSYLEGKPVDGLTGYEWNPDPSGLEIYVHNLTDFTVADPPHSWDPVHRQWNGGRNDGFVKEHAGADQNDVMGFHVREQLRTLYRLADVGAVCDHWYASCLGPTWPNRFYLHGATSNGMKSNLPLVSFTSVFEQLAAAGKTTKNYYHDIPWALGGYGKLSGNAGIDQFFADAAAGTLPNFCIVDPQFFGAGANDDHPDHDVQFGQALLATVYAALAASPQWNRMLFVITYDEHGGFYDHVPPPVAVDAETDFRRHGFRVPSVVLGPYVRKGCVVRTAFDHSSVSKTAAVRFGLPSLSARQDAANDLSACIHPAYLSAPQPPAVLSPFRVELSKVRRVPTQSTAHQELADAVARMSLPPGLDRRSVGLGEMAKVLARGEQLGALTLVR